MSQYISITIGILLLLTIFYIWMERRKYVNLKELIEYPLEVPILIYNLNDFVDVTKLIKAYTYIKNDQNTDIKTVILALKYLKETQLKNQGFEDIFKIVTSVVPITAIMVTLSIALVKDPKIITSIGSLTIDFASLLVIILVFVSLYSLINNFSSSKISILINKHLLIAEEVHKEELSVDAADEEKSD